MSNRVEQAATYSIEVLTPEGDNNLINDITEFFSLDYILAYHTVTKLTLIVPNNSSNVKIRKDTRLAVMREIPGLSPYLHGGTIWFVRWINTTIDVITIIAYSSLYLFGSPGGFGSGRVAAYKDGNAKAFLSGSSDDIMKTIIRDNYLAASISTDRVIDDTQAGVDLTAYLSVAPNDGIGVSIDKSFSMQPILPLLRDIHFSSVELGTATFFNLQSSIASEMTFVTTITTPNTDRRDTTANPVIFEDDSESLTNVSLTEDWTREASAGIAGGRFLDEGRDYGTAVNDSIIQSSPFGYREVLRNASYAKDDSNTLSDEAKSIINEFKMTESLSAQMVNLPGQRLGVDFKFGDMVTVVAFGRKFDPIISPIRMSIANGNENITTILRNLS